MIEIREGTLDSLDAAMLVANLLRELDARYPGQENGGPLEVSEVARPEGVFLIATIDSKPAGCGALRRIRDDLAEIKRMYVEPWARGRGLSRRILERLEEEAIAMGYQSVRLETGNRQPEAIGLYESSGYSRVELFALYVGSSISICFEKQICEV